MEISIHAPARGATDVGSLRCRTGTISIHAPARGATEFCDPKPEITANFNPRSREGSDERTAGIVKATDIFQSTLPRGERRRWELTMPDWHYFNPRSREGSDGAVTAYAGSDMISIHAPARGAT